MIAQVKQKLEELNKHSVSTLCADFIEQMPQDLHFDYIFSSLVLHHIKDTEGILRRLFSILNNAGLLLIIDLDSDDGSFHAKYPDFDGYNGFEQPSLVELTIKAGFTNAAVETSFCFRNNISALKKK